MGINFSKAYPRKVDSGVFYLVRSMVEVDVEVSIDGYYVVIDRGITGEPIDSHYAATSSTFSNT